jgi:CRP/FNR family cyclic AMP-dependent transcriptional regulator
VEAAANNGLPPTLIPQDCLWSRIVDLLESTHWADNLTGKDVLRLSNYLQVCAVSRGALIVDEGSHDAYMCLLVEGKVAVIKRDHGDATKRVGEIRPGKTFGEMSLVDGEPRSASVIAEETSTLIILTADDFARLASDYPKLAMKVVLKISKLLSQRLRQTTGILADHIGR